MGIRIAWSARSTGGKVKLACPAPRITGATITCSRSRHPAARNRDTVDRAAFDQDSAKAVAGQSGKDRRRRDLPVTCRQGNCFNARWRRAPCSLRNDQQAARTIGSKYLGFAAQPAFGIDDHARRMRSRHTPHGELRIVGDGGADAYNDTVYQSPQPMQVGKARRAVDVF